MTLADAVVTYIDYHQSIGMRFQVDAGMLRAFHRQTGDVHLAAVSADQVAAFLQPRHQVTSTWRMKHRALRRFYQHWIARGLVTRSPVPTAVPRSSDTFVPHIYSDEELRRLLRGIEGHQTRICCTIWRSVSAVTAASGWPIHRVRRTSTTCCAQMASRACATSSPAPSG